MLIKYLNGWCLPSTKIGEKTADMVRTLIKFDQVVVACFGQDLDPCFRASIMEFEKSGSDPSRQGPGGDGHREGRGEGLIDLDDVMEL